MGQDAFISYSSKDKHTADAVCAVLESEGIRCWIAPRDIRPGADWGESIIDAINGTKIFVLVFSQNANSSTQIKREVERAVNKGIPVIPFRIEDVLPAKSLEYFLSTPHWLDAFTPPIDRHIRYLAETIKSLLSNRPRPVPAPPPPAPGVKVQPWQIAGGVAAAAVLAGWYFLAPAGSPTDIPPPLPPAPAPDTAPALPPAPAPALPADVAPPSPPGARTVPPAAPGRAAESATAPGQEFAGRWRSEQISFTPGPMAQAFGTQAFGEMLYAAFTGPDMNAQLDVGRQGQSTYTIEAEDHGTVAFTGVFTFTSALSGKSITVQVYPLTPLQTAGMMNFGARPGDSALVFNMPGRSDMAWFGNAQANAGPVARWHNSSQAGFTGDLTISGGKYQLKVTQVMRGVFETQGGRWTLKPDSGIPLSGTYRFDGNDKVTTVADTGTIVWTRAN